ncbi:MAG: glycosyltransferase family 2 protein [Bradymonadia bacterium]
MPLPLISAIIPIRNRSSDRLENCLRALRWQDLPDDQYEVILSDFGSSPEEARLLLEMAERHGARVVRTDTDEVWNRSRALNYGIRAARGDFVFCTDADMIFAPNFLSTLLSTQQANADQAFVVCRCRDLPESVPEQPWRFEDFPDLLSKADFREKLGTGACQMAKRSFFNDIRGYDEGFKFWGMEDNDMKFRATRSGLSLIWVHEQTSMLHQWHPSDRGKRPFRKFLNDVRFHVSKYRRRKNLVRWGGQP